MERQFKNISLLTDEGEKGSVKAVFSVFNEVDSDVDVVLPNSIKSGYGEKGVAMVWGHDWKDVSGRGEIVEEEGQAVFKGQFIMDTQRGKDAYETMISREYLPREFVDYVSTLKNGTTSGNVENIFEPNINVIYESKTHIDFFRRRNV